MLRFLVKSFLGVVLVMTSAFAVEDLGNFDDQDYSAYSEPQSKENYFAYLMPMSNDNNRYFGASLGAGILQMKPEIMINGVAESKKKSGTAYDLSVYGGMGTNFGHLYLGGELGLGFGTLDRKFSSGNATMKLKRPVTASFDFMPGYLNHSRTILFYGRFGTEAGLFKLELENLRDLNKVVFGWHAGLGFEFFLSESMSFRTEYVYTKYSSLGDLIFKDAMQYRYKSGDLNVHKINLGLAIHF